MESFKKNAEYLQSQSKAFNGISEQDVRILFNDFMLDIASILNHKGEHSANISFINAVEELKYEKSKDDEKSN